MSEPINKEKEFNSSSSSSSSHTSESNTNTELQYDDQVDDSVYKRDQKSKWTRARSADKKDGNVNGNKRTRPNPNSEEKRQRKTYDQTEFKPMLDDEGNPIPKSERKPKKKVAVMIGYCGTGYNGMQLQNDPKIPTIERDIYEAMARAGAISPENAVDIKKSSFMRAARTDKGVHAAGNVISLKMIIEDPEIINKLNQELPDQIRVWGVQRVTKSFDCRKMCSSRVYEYLLPTYSLLPPKPKSTLSELLSTKRSTTPGILKEDEEGIQWWKDTREFILKEGELTPQQLDEEIPALLIDDSVKIYNEAGEVTEQGKFIRKVKGLENKARRNYKASPERLELFRNAMKQYEGTHNFHNFTVGKFFKDPSAKRYIISTKVSDPFDIEGTQWVSIKIHGQSFMLHQIRKMIAMATLVVRTGCPTEIIPQCFTSTKINIPKAPALGLLLENPVYEAYNQTLSKLEYDAIDFTKFDKEMEEFKMKYIYDKIYAEENKENVFYGFFAFIDTFKLKDEDNRADGTHVFDFLNSITDELPEKVIEESNTTGPITSSDNVD
ncbi:pseudouridine synthase [Scheffersomyces amazonensis]|uniref:pseudouridine synthase n=1 Tax=Scheffersomyces amazonensis TaxID=1078765 RepID=UPI00315DAAD1